MGNRGSKRRKPEPTGPAGHAREGPARLSEEGRHQPRAPPPPSQPGVEDDSAGPSHDQMPAPQEKPDQSRKRLKADLNGAGAPRLNNPAQLFPWFQEMRSSLPTGVREYFYFIKEKVSSDWKDLAFHLGFEQSDIDNIAGRNRDDKSCCMDLLEEWLKHNGERATIVALIEALSEAGLQSTADELKGTYTVTVRDVFQESVKSYYELKLTNFNPLIWNDSFTLMYSEIFTELELIYKSSYWLKATQVEKRKKLNSLDDIFHLRIIERATVPRRILIEGEAGGGKTTFLSKEAIDAVSQKTELGRRFDIVLLIRLWEVREGETIEEMVWDQCVPETAEGVYVQSIKAILQRNESRVLFLLDGYDELRPGARAIGQAISKLLSGKTYPKSTVVITSRPSAGVQQHTQPDCHMRIMGFSPDHVKKYVRQYFSIVGKPEIAEKLISTLDESQLVTDMTCTPLFLMLVCVLWEEDQRMVTVGTRTGLYSDLLTDLIRKHCKREGVDMPTDELADALLHLGKLALQALLRNETLVDITEVERRQLNFELLLKLGVVSLEVSPSKRQPRKQLNFSHKTMQEFLAGRYVAHAVVNQDISIVELLQLTSITKALELSNLILFTCGNDSRAALTICTVLSNLSSKEFSHVQADDFKLKSLIPIAPEVKKSAETYKRFVLLCLDILSERPETDTLQTVSRALPILIIDNVRDDRHYAALKYYLENTHPLHLPKRSILRVIRLFYPVALRL